MTTKREREGGRGEGGGREGKKGRLRYMCTWGRGWL